MPFIDTGQEEAVIENENQVIKQCAVFLFLLGLACFIYRGFRISGLYMDDLYMWSFYREQSFLEYVFPAHSVRFRPMYWFAAWIELGIIQNNVNWIVPINIVIAAVIAYYLYYLAAKLSGSQLLGVFFGAMFLASRFAYYNIGQLLGLMESMCIVFCLGIAHALYIYITEEKKWSYYTAVVLYIGICFTHERYMVLLPVFLLVLLFVKCKDARMYAAVIFGFCLVQIARAVTIGTVLPAGTGKTNVVETFTVGSFFRSLLSEILYLFGVNAGPEHLNGLPWENMPGIIRYLVYLSAIIALLLVSYYVLCLFFVRIHRQLFKRNLYVSLLLILMIGASLISSAVTIRVEMRWIYSSYALMLLLIAHMHALLVKSINMRLHAITPEREMSILLWVPTVMIVLWGICLLPMEIISYQNFDKIYLFPNQKRYNSLADETFGKYGEKLYDKELYIVGNRYEMKDFTKETFFKVYDKSNKGIKVTHIDSIKEIGLITDRMIVLKEDPAHDVFVDATDIYRDMKLEIIDGYYRDGWMEEEAQINVMAGASGEIRLEFMYPGVLDGQQVMNLSIDGELTRIDIEENIFIYTIQAKPFALVNLQFVNEFVFPDAQEQRSDRKLSIIMNVTAN